MAAKKPRRSGTWMREEEEYAAYCIKLFDNGLLELKEGITLRAHLAEKLSCDPMRVSKKFGGMGILRKRVYNKQKGRPALNLKAVAKAQAELAKFENRFLERCDTPRVEDRKGTGLTYDFTFDGDRTTVVSSPAIDALIMQSHGNRFFRLGEEDLAAAQSPLPQMIEKTSESQKQAEQEKRRRLEQETVKTQRLKDRDVEQQKISVSPVTTHHFPRPKRKKPKPKPKTPPKKPQQPQQTQQGPQTVTHPPDHFYRNQWYEAELWNRHQQQQQQQQQQKEQQQKEEEEQQQKQQKQQQQQQQQQQQTSWQNDLTNCHFEQDDVDFTCDMLKATDYSGGHTTGGAVRDESARIVTESMIEMLKDGGGSMAVVEEDEDDVFAMAEGSDTAKTKTKEAEVEEQQKQQQQQQQQQQQRQQRQQRQQQQFEMARNLQQFRVQGCPPQDGAKGWSRQAQCDPAPLLGSVGNFGGPFGGEAMGEAPMESRGGSVPTAVVPRKEPGASPSFAKPPPEILHVGPVYRGSTARGTAHDGKAERGQDVLAMSISPPPPPQQSEPQPQLLQLLLQPPHHPLLPSVPVVPPKDASPLSPRTKLIREEKEKTDQAELLLEFSQFDRSP